MQKKASAECMNVPSKKSVPDQIDHIRTKIFLAIIQNNTHQTVSKPAALKVVISTNLSLSFRLYDKYTHTQQVERTQGLCTTPLTG